MLWQEEHTKRPAGFSPEHGSRRFFAQWRHAVRPDSEQRRLELLWDMEGLARLNLQIAWCWCGMDGSGESSERRYLAGEAALDGGSGGFHGAPAGDGRLGGDVVCGA